jgi:hypothetical protein
MNDFNQQQLVHLTLKQPSHPCRQRLKVPCWFGDGTTDSGAKAKEQQAAKA